MLLKRAIVIENDDSGFDGDKLSRIKVKVLPELKDVKTDKLPWIKPFCVGNGAGENSTAQNIPEVDSNIWVIVLDEFWKEIRYLWGVDVEGYVPYQKWEGASGIGSKISDIDSQTYPQPYKFEYYEDGSASFRNTSTGETGLIHATGTYAIFDKDGNIINYAKNKKINLYNDQADILLDTTGELTIDTKASNFTIKNNSCTIAASLISVVINDNLEVLV